MPSAATTNHTDAVLGPLLLSLWFGFKGKKPKALFFYRSNCVHNTKLWTRRFELGRAGMHQPIPTTGLCLGSLLLSLWLWRSPLIEFGGEKHRWGEATRNCFLLFFWAYEIFPSFRLQLLGTSKPLQKPKRSDHKYHKCLCTYKSYHDFIQKHYSKITNETTWVSCWSQQLYIPNTMQLPKKTGHESLLFPTMENLYSCCP
jgi:hypothetical protein